MSKDQESALQDQALKLAEVQKKGISQGFSNTRQDLNTSEKKVTQLISQKKSLEEQLDIREAEMQIFRESNAKQQELLNKVIQLKEKEIANLKEQLRSITFELDEASVQIGEYTAQIHEIEKKLSRKSKKVESLRKANALTKQELDLERKKVDQFRSQQTSLQESEEKFRRETRVR